MNDVTLSIHATSLSIHATSSPAEPLAVLVSGGLDSAILLGEALRWCPEVQPIYVRAGLMWEAVELAALRRFLTALDSPRLRPLVVLDQPIGDVYGGHWSTTGEEVPDDQTADEAVFLPGRNVLLLSKPMLWCHLNRLPALALAPLQSNPFPDATDSFFRAFQDVVNQAIGGSVQILRPYAHLGKVDVLKRGRHLPLGETFSCIAPIEGRHCGACNKCAERQRGFAQANLPDPTEYVES